LWSCASICSPAFQGYFSHSILFVLLFLIFFIGISSLKKNVDGPDQVVLGQFWVAGLVLGQFWVWIGLYSNWTSLVSVQIGFKFWVIQIAYSCHVRLYFELPDKILQPVELYWIWLDQWRSRSTKLCIARLDTDPIPC
jgi:hypothetical protein